jgi:hypothetical protein
VTISPGKMRLGSPDRNVERFAAMTTSQWRITSESVGRRVETRVNDVRAISQRLSPGRTTTRVAADDDGASVAGVATTGAAAGGAVDVVVGAAVVDVVAAAADAGADEVVVTVVGVALGAGARTTG